MKYKLGNYDITKECTTKQYTYKFNISDDDYFAFSVELLLDANPDLVSYDRYWKSLNVGSYAFELIDFDVDSQCLIGKLVKPE